MQQPSIVITDPIYLPEKYKDRLERLGKLTVHEDEPESVEELKERLERADIAIVGRCQIPAEVFKGLKRLRLMALWRTGYDDVDIEAASRQGIAVANAPGYSNEAVAEHVFALLLSYLRRVPEADFWMHEGRFECDTLRGHELKGKTIGVVGTGRIGARVVEISGCFGMEVIAYDLKPSGELANIYGFTYVDLDELYKKSDFISLHLPLAKETACMVDMNAFRKMKRTAVLINTARGGLVDEHALVAALSTHMIAGACLDVFTQEPVPRDSPLLKLDNVVMTPHTAYNTWEAVENCTRITVENVEAFLRGKPINVINLETIKP